MNFRDQQLTCTVCGKTFIFAVTEQRKLYEPGQEVVPPANCRNCRTRDPGTGRWSGQVKWFSHERGYGFIVKPNGDEVFFHRSQVVDELRGPEARQVRAEST